MKWGSGKVSNECLAVSSVFRSAVWGPRLSLITCCLFSIFPKSEPRTPFLCLKMKIHLCNTNIYLSIWEKNTQINSLQQPSHPSRQRKQEGKGLMMNNGKWQAVKSLKRDKSNGSVKNIARMSAPKALSCVRHKTNAKVQSGHQFGCNKYPLIMEGKRRQGCAGKGD